MAEKKKLGSVKRFGARYGRRVKHKLAEIEAVQRGKHICPYCRAQRVKRVAAGIWECRKCESKFTGKAYSVKKSIIKEEEKEE
ncbi:50S ribosomal protein L37ae [Candidatus Woesearchaeota archaeon]|nr:50S ribosomal protein L37ae [Candidatus Woesearchaeota archaeon]